jgi:23S rRNA pseudouridine1911/1915/1917 synthase
MPISGPIPPDGTMRLHVPPDQGGTRLDRFLANTLGTGRRAVARIAALVRVDGRRAAMGKVLAGGEEVTLSITAAVSPQHAPLGHSAPIDAAIVVAVKPDVVVLGKPAGIPTVTHALGRQPTLASELARTMPECASIGRPGESGIVHRLDTETSGVVLAARTVAAYHYLREQFRRHAVEKTYLALVWGTIDRPLSIDLPIGQHRKSRRRVQAILRPTVATRYTVLDAATRIDPVRSLPGMTLVRATTRTGRRHQVRVHLAAAGHPLVGDRLYGDPEQDTRMPESIVGLGHWLHAAAVSWQPDGEGERIVVEVPPPREWNERLEGLARRARR